MMGIPTKKWDNLPSPGLMFSQTPPQGVLQKEPINDESQEALSHNKPNTNVMHMVYTNLAAAAESIIDKNWCLLENQSTCNAIINGKYFSNIRDAPDGQYSHVHWNAGVIYTKQIGDLPGYSNVFWYNPKGIYNILSLRLVQKHYLVTYNSHYGNSFFIHIPHRPTLKKTKSGIFNRNMRHLPQNKNNAHIVVND